MDDSTGKRCSVRGRVFLVGCPRSGTTILQQCISSHSRIASFPETDFFAKLIGRREGALLARCNRVNSERRQRAWDKMERVFGKASIPSETGSGSRLDRTVSVYKDFLDSIACSRGCDIWLEKTPRHFRYVDIIERAIPASVFIHVVRDGRAVVGSIVDRAIRYPERFGEERNAEDAARLWNEALHKTAERARKSGDLVIHHDEFMEKPEHVLANVCKWLGVTYESTMISEGDGESIIEPEESWKDLVQLGVMNVKDKFQEVLTEPEQNRVSRILDWSTYRYLQRVGRNRDPGQ